MAIVSGSHQRQKHHHQRVSVLYLFYSYNDLDFLIIYEEEDKRKVNALTVKIAKCYTKEEIIETVVVHHLRFRNQFILIVMG